MSGVVGTYVHMTEDLKLRLQVESKESGMTQRQIIHAALSAYLDMSAKAAPRPEQLSWQEAC